MLRSNCIPKHIIQKKLGEGTQVTEIPRRRRNSVLGEFNDKTGYGE
jgi:hypothetical protein